MNWKSMIPNCFGQQDAIFAGHWADRSQAKKAITAAKKAGASRNDFERELADYISRDVANPQYRDRRLAEQSKELAKLW